MNIVKISFEINVKQCMRCHRGTEYYCQFCRHDLCRHCKTLHVWDLNTRHHKITIYREKFKCPRYQEKCVKHRESIYTRYCEPCKVPVCDYCTEHTRERSLLLSSSFSKNKKHKLIGLKEAYETKRRQHTAILHEIRREALYIRSVSEIRTMSDAPIRNKEIFEIRSIVEISGRRLKYLLDSVVIDVVNLQKCLLQSITSGEYIARIQNYEYMCERFTNRPVNFLRFIKNTNLPQIKDTPRFRQNSRLSLTKGINMEFLLKLLSEIKLIERGKRQTKHEGLLTLMPSPMLQKTKTIRVKKAFGCEHISSVTSGHVWISHNISKTLILTDTATGDVLHIVEDSLYASDLSISVGLHTVNNKHELIYIAWDKSIKILPSDKGTTTTLLEIDSSWNPLCIYWSTATGDLLVGMHERNSSTKKEICTGRVTRYNSAGQVIQIIERNKSRSLYSTPIYLTENTNGDVVVSDLWQAVVVTDRGGRRRFSYKGPNFEPRLAPWGVCTDALSHILVCDFNTNTVQVIDKDGQFLFYLPVAFRLPRSLCYDFNTHTLWIGSFYNRMCGYRYINGHLATPRERDDMES